MSQSTDLDAAPQIATISAPDVIARFDDLPTLAPVAVEVLRLAEDDDASMSDITDVIETDPGLTLRLMRLANSAAYNRGTEVTTVNRAAIVLGLRTLKLVTLGFSLVANLNSSEVDTALLWRRSLVSSVLARRFALDRNPVTADDAFVAGMLANTGKLALAEEPAYVEALQRCGMWIRPHQEKELLGLTSDEVTVGMLTNWGLPDVLVTAVAERNMEPGDPNQGDLGAVLRVCDHAAELLLTVGDDEASAAAFDSLTLTAAANCGLTVGDIEPVLEELQPELAEMANMFDLEPASQKSPTELVQGAHAQLVRISMDLTGDLAKAKEKNEALTQQNVALEEAASTDALTGLPNRRTFSAYLTNRIAGRLRSPRPTLLGLILIDVDHFKSVNDRYGHGVGDEVLTELGERLLDGTRRGELPARIGGEEFALILPELRVDELKGVTDRLLTLVNETPFATSAGPLPITVSIGAAYTASVTLDTEGDLMEIADRALYDSKENGRNRATITSAD
ncbi:MAG: diguanylate cyclase [Actinomycetota bacterium]